MDLRAVSTTGLLGSPVSRLITVMLSISFLQVERELARLINLVISLDQFMDGKKPSCPLTRWLRLGLTGFLCRLFKATNYIFSRNNAFQMTISAHYWEASDLQVDHELKNSC